MIFFDSTTLITEAFAAVALILNIFAYLRSNMKYYRVLSGMAMLLLSIHFFRLDAYAAAVGCCLAFFRNIVSLKYNDWITTGIFVALNILSISIEWFYFHHTDLEIFIAYTASIIFTVGTLRLQNVVEIRRWFTLAEGLNLIYGLIVGSIFGSIYSCLNVIVLLIFWIKRYRQTSA